MTQSTAPFQERITSIDRRRVGDILPNERNPKQPTHLKQERLTAVLSQFGKAGVLLTYFDNEGVERFFDGNTRRGIDPDDVWYIAQTDLSQKEVDDLVMLYDPLAEPDWEPELLKMLAEETAVEGGVLGDMLAEILEELGAGMEAGGQEGDKLTPDEARQTLAERFGVPPFSVLDARQGYWQERKRAWLALGIQSELGRGDVLLYEAEQVNSDGLNYDSNLTRSSSGGGKRLTWNIDPNGQSYASGKKAGKYGISQRPNATQG